MLWDFTKPKSTQVHFTKCWIRDTENLVEENNTKFVENLSEFAGFVTEIVTQIGENLRESPKFSQFYRKSFRLLYAHRHWCQTAVYPSVPEKSLSLQTSRSMLYIVRPFGAKQLDTQNNSTTFNYNEIWNSTIPANRGDVKKV